MGDLAMREPVAWWEAIYPPVKPGYRRVSEWWGWEDVPINETEKSDV